MRNQQGRILFLDFGLQTIMYLGKQTKEQNIEAVIKIHIFKCLIS